MITQSKTGIVVLASIVTSVVVIGLIAAEITPHSTNYKGRWVFGSWSDIMILFISSCMSVFFGALLAATSAIGDPSDTIMKTKFFLATQLVLAIFFLTSSIAVLAWNRGDEGIAAGVFGLFSGILHALALMASKVLG